MRRINRVRARHGRRRLQWDKQLGYVARRHARVMAANRAVYHDSNMGSEITRWRALAQNTGGGRGCKRVSRAFMRSTSHRANVLGRWRHLGVGVERRGGRLYVQQVFEYRADPGNIYHWP